MSKLKPSEQTHSTLNSAAYARAKTCRSIGVTFFLQAQLTVVSVNIQATQCRPYSRTILPNVVHLDDNKDRCFGHFFSVLILIRTFAGVSAFIRFSLALALLSDALSCLVFLSALGSVRFRSGWPLSFVYMCCVEIHERSKASARRRQCSQYTFCNCFGVSSSGHIVKGHGRVGNDTIRALSSEKLLIINFEISNIPSSSRSSSVASVIWKKSSEDCVDVEIENVMNWSAWRCRWKSWLRPPGLLPRYFRTFGASGIRIKPIRMVWMCVLKEKNLYEQRTSLRSNWETSSSGNRGVGVWPSATLWRIASSESSRSAWSSTTW